MGLEFSLEKNLNHKQMHVFYGHYIDLNINYKDKKKSKYKNNGVSGLIFLLRNMILIKD